jgi:hypothetical protein
MAFLNKLTSLSPLKSRLVIYAYNHHVRLLSPEPEVFDKPQGRGADIVMQSSADREFNCLVIRRKLRQLSLAELLYLREALQPILICRAF